MIRFRGSNATRARTLAKRKRRPKFALGEIVVDVAWLKRQETRPKTGTTGVWYSVIYGAGIAGELDLVRPKRR